MKRRLIASLVAALLATPAYAADSTVAAMTAGSAISGTDLFYCSQAGGTNDRKCTGTQLGAWALSATNVAAVSGGGTTNFLRADGTWTTAGGGSPGGSNTQVQFNNSSAFGGSANFTWDNTNFIIGVSHASLASTIADGLSMSNSTAATNSQNQNSPALHWIGQGWDTASRQIEMQTFLQSRTASSTIYPQFLLTPTINGSAQKSIAFVSSSSGMYISGLDGIASYGPDNGAGWAGIGPAGSSNTFGFFTNAALRFGATNSGVTLPSASGVTWTSTTAITGTSDTYLTRAAAAVLQINGASNAIGGLTLFNGATLSAGEIAIPKVTASGTAPGAAGAKLSLVCGTNAGTAKIIVYGGTSTTPVTLLDNIGSGVTGC